jgi:hypothetical protein
MNRQVLRDADGRPADERLRRTVRLHDHDTELRTRALPDGTLLVMLSSGDGGHVLEVRLTDEHESTLWKLLDDREEAKAGQLNGEWNNWGNDA